MDCMRDKGGVGEWGSRGVEKWGSRQEERVHGRNPEADRAVARGGHKQATCRRVAECSNSICVIRVAIGAHSRRAQMPHHNHSILGPTC